MSASPNRPVAVKRFKTIDDNGVDVARREGGGAVFRFTPPPAAEHTAQAVPGTERDAIVN